MITLNSLELGAYTGMKGQTAPSLTVTNGGKLSVKFTLKSSGKRVDITRYRGTKPCGWMSLVEIDKAEVNLQNLLSNGYTPMVAT